MMRKSTLLFTVLFISLVSVHAQKRSAFGFGITAIDFETAARIKNSSLTDALNDNEWLGFNNKTFGLNLDYWRELTNKIDFVVSRPCSLHFPIALSIALCLPISSAVTVVPSSK